MTNENRKKKKRLTHERGEIVASRFIKRQINKTFKVLLIFFWCEDILMDFTSTLKKRLRKDKIVFILYGVFFFFHI